ncbi:ERCC4 domain-containing protein [Bacillus sp. Marseille-P3661]|uniref:ERCC4 domain-containing protein n=1 Tax=Bacillus sp. Marseille-P3661 TaxID=1936234 RepID=UPI000C83CB34|nr:ERCC4 domain-containing protein [Bacillus sp. Marseille-P3661]
MKAGDCVHIPYMYTDAEIKEALNSMTILIDTREQQNEHITKYFDTKGIRYKTRKLDTGDYMAVIPPNEKLGIIKPIQFQAAIERKNSIDELAQSIKERNRFENELIRAQKLHFTMIVEDPNGYENILKGNYRSQYKPQALLGSLKTFESRYHFSTVFLLDRTVGNYIYHHFYYLARNQLKC